VSGYYPVNLKIENKKCVVVGGGKVAERKINLLLEKGALVTVISPKITSLLEKLWRATKVNYLPVTYSPSSLKDAFLVIAASNDRTVNSRVAKDADQLGILVNVVDSPAESSFILPAILSRGDLTIAVSTAGRSPALARKIKEDLALIYSKEYGDLIEILAQARERIKRKYPDPERRQQIWREIMEKI
jgi:precorrin-2 dehydrogenase/sirohydrochlorin ferrochelatase